MKVKKQQCHCSIKQLDDCEIRSVSGGVLPMVPGVSTATMGTIIGFCVAGPVGAVVGGVAGGVVGWVVGFWMNLTNLYQDEVS